MSPYIAVDLKNRASNLFKARGLLLIELWRSKIGHRRMAFGLKPMQTKPVTTQSICAVTFFYSFFSQSWLANQIPHSHRIPHQTQAHNDAFAFGREIAVVPKRLAGMNVGNMNLDRGGCHGRKGVGNGD